MPEETPSPASRSPRAGPGTLPWLLGALAALIALTFALYTDHRWEDYYITFRSSKHLATGEGLVYQPGERVHTFTSPLGVLLPAVASVMTLNRSDEAALWLFRLFCIGALAAAVILLGRLAAGRNYGLIATLLLTGLVMTDAKTVDFSINGMETAWMLLFLAGMVLAAERAGQGAWRALGVAWAGLMWTRPDSFIYIGAYALGVGLFAAGGAAGAGRAAWFGQCVRAGLLTTALYLPWFLFAWIYYGSPVPHTIAAKSMVNDPLTLERIASTVVTFPLAALEGRLALDSTFLPAYFDMGGWPGWLTIVGRGLALTCAVVWLVPGLAPGPKAASLTYFLAQLYLWLFPNHPFPWYLPSATFFAILTLAGVLHQGLGFARWLGTVDGAGPVGRRLARGLAAGAVALLVVSGGLLWAVAGQAEAQQRIVEDQNRKQIGLWLREHAQPGDTVFMEPLGYIGYFSGLKTLDFPGMSAPETVAARELLGNDFTHLISWLEPTWLVLRPRELEQMIGRDRGIVDGTYRVVRTFSVADEVEALDVAGKPYLRFDAEFVLLRRERSAKVPLENGVAYSPFQASRMVHDGRPATFLHTPGAWLLPIPPEARRVRVGYGFIPEATAGAERTDGAHFEVFVASSGRPLRVHDRFLDPAAVVEDRGWHSVEIELPAAVAGATLVLRANPHLTTRFDYTYWTDPEFLP